MSSNKAKQSKGSLHKGVATLTKKKKTSASSSSSPSSFKNAKPSKSENYSLPIHDANLIEDAETVVSDWNGEKFVGARVAKPFGGKIKKWFYGTVKSFNCDKKTKEKSWQIQFDDGDEESMDDHEVTHWLQQYNTLWLEEFQSSQIPHRTAEPQSKTKKKKKSDGDQHATHYKVCWKASHTIVEFGYEAFEDCYGEDVRATEKMYREAEVHIPPTQQKELYTSLADANIMAENIYRMLAHLYIDDDDRCKVKQNDEQDNGCRSWKWSYSFQDDEYENTFRCEGYVRVEKVTNWL